MEKETKTEGAKASSVKTVKVKALIHLSGHYKLAWSEGQTFDCEEKQAKELVDAKAAEYVK